MAPSVSLSHYSADTRHVVWVISAEMTHTTWLAYRPKMTQKQRSAPRPEEYIRRGFSPRKGGYFLFKNFLHQIPYTREILLVFWIYFIFSLDFTIQIPLYHSTYPKSREIHWVVLAGDTSRSGIIGRLIKEYKDGPRSGTTSVRYGRPPYTILIDPRSPENLYAPTTLLPIRTSRDIHSLLLVPTTNPSTRYHTTTTISFRLYL